ncbi:MAG TPA: hypothetical protein VFQ53_39560 [Kofleriaceae bacterium]|nr:hypothetical protein [Kofleriaceae bacterium]
MTPFGEIIRRAVEATPGAVGGAFADPQGEMVDGYTRSYAAHDWAILTAHYGVILAHLHAAFGIWHFGGPEYFVAQHAQLGVFVHAVDGGYYALLAVREAHAEGDALASLREAAIALRKEMA